jgi:hypothetical protein
MADACPQCRTFTSAERCLVCVSFQRARYRGRLLDANGRIFVDPNRSARWVRAIIPRLAARLADRLEQLRWEDDPPPAHEISASTTLRELAATHELITASQWLQAMELIAAGTRIGPALQRTGIPNGVFRGYVRVERRLKAHLNSCNRRAKRRRWPMLTVEEILEDISTGNGSARDAVMKRGYSLNDYKTFIRMTQQRGSQLEKGYLNAKSAQNMRLFEQTFGMDVDEMIARGGKRWLNAQENRINQLRPLRLRKREARARRVQEYGPESELDVRIREARRRAKRAAR